MIKTNVKASPEEVVELKGLLQTAQTTPVIALSTADAMSGRDFSSLAWNRVKERCHAVALAHGLPEIPGFYGCDLKTGEFVRD